jgi:hypothetical protein
MTMLGGWCWSTEPSRLPEIERAFRVVIAADDPELALHPPVRRRTRADRSSDRDPASVTVVSLRPRAVTAREIGAIHAYTNPARAGYQLAKVITGLPDELLALIGRDQITDDAILGCPVAEEARPILRAIDDRHEPVVEIPWHGPDVPSEDTRDQDIATEMPPPVDRDFATELGSLLHGRSVRIPSRDLSRPVRSHKRVGRSADIPRESH